MSIILVIFSLILGLLCLFIGLIVLMQRASSNAGMGSALGGGMAESAFGGETGNVLTRLTIWSIVGFFILSLLLYMGYLYQSQQDGSVQGPTLADAVAEAAQQAETKQAPEAAAPAAAEGKTEAAAPKTEASSATAEAPAPQK